MHRFTTRIIYIGIIITALLSINSCAQESLTVIKYGSDDFTETYVSPDSLREGAVYVYSDKRLGTFYESGLLHKLVFIRTDEHLSEGKVYRIQSGTPTFYDIHSALDCQFTYDETRKIEIEYGLEKRTLDRFSSVKVNAVACNKREILYEGEIPIGIRNQVEMYLAVYLIAENSPSDEIPIIKSKTVKLKGKKIE